jgi:copper chaperone CopZ
MKKNNLIIPALFLLGVLLSVFFTGCQSSEGKEANFKVYGNCEMCKKTIESSLKDEKGINSANWNVKTKIIAVSYDSTLIDEKGIHKKIAGAGYDTELEKGNDNAYNNLHSCCQYKRKD